MESTNQEGENMEEEEGMELEALYRRYCVRLKHALFASAMGIAIVCSLLTIVAVSVLQTTPESWKMDVWTLGAVVCVLTLVAAGMQLPAAAEWEALSLASSLLVILTLATAVLLLGLNHAPLPLFALILMIHTMMPISRLVAVGAAGLLTLLYLAMALAFLLTQKHPTYYRQIVCEALFLIGASCVGLYYRTLTERAHRETFAGTKTCLEQRVKLECEREQQEKLLLSVIPAYIAAEPT